MTDTSHPLIVIADRREDERELYGEYFEWAGFRVELAATAAVAEEKIRSLAPDAIVVGLALCDRTGDELCEELKADPTTRHIPVIILTTQTFGAAHERTLSAQADALLLKPCLPSDLLTEVQRLIPRRDRKRLRNPKLRAVVALKRTQERRYRAFGERRAAYLAQEWQRWVQPRGTAATPRDVTES